MNDRRRYIVTSSLIGWAYTQNDHWNCFMVVVKQKCLKQIVPPFRTGIGKPTLQWRTSRYFSPLRHVSSRPWRWILVWSSWLGPKTARTSPDLQTTRGMKWPQTWPTGSASSCCSVWERLLCLSVSYTELQGKSSQPTTVKKLHHMMTLCHGNSLRITGLLWRESINGSLHKGSVT